MTRDAGEQELVLSCSPVPPFLIAPLASGARLIAPRSGGRLFSYGERSAARNYSSSGGSCSLAARRSSA